MKHHILLVDDDLAFRKSMTDFLEDEGFRITAVESGDEAIALIRQGLCEFSVALIDYHMPILSGLETIRAIKQIDSNLTVFTFSGDDSVEAFNSSLASGAVYFIEKEISNEKLLGLLHRACLEVDKKTKVISIGDHSENQKLIEKIGMIGVSDSMADVAKAVLKFAPVNESVIIRGENGTGKEKIARALHNHSSRSKGPFVAVNCGAIPESLIESEFFGHEKGSFTGAIKNKIGYVEAADGGTLFLDEIGDLSKHLQVKLLRVLQEKSITPVGSNQSQKIDFRLVTATNVKLEEMIQEGDFREDLYFRLNVLPIFIKPLRERAEDIGVLALHFLNQANRETNQSKILTENAVDELKKLKWGGNVRELEHAIKFMVTMSSDDILDVSLVTKSKNSLVSNVKNKNLDDFKLNNLKDEKKIVLKALEQGGSISAASKMLNISRTTLRYKMKKYKLVFDQLMQKEGEI